MNTSGRLFDLQPEQGLSLTLTTHTSYIIIECFYLLWFLWGLKNTTWWCHQSLMIGVCWHPLHHSFSKIISARSAAKTCSSLLFREVLSFVLQSCENPPSAGCLSGMKKDSQPYFDTDSFACLCVCASCPGLSEEQSQISNVIYLNSKCGCTGRPDSKFQCWFYMFLFLKWSTRRHIWVFKNQSHLCVLSEPFLSWSYDISKLVSQSEERSSGSLFWLDGSFLSDPAQIDNTKDKTPTETKYCKCWMIGSGGCDLWHHKVVEVPAASWVAEFRLYVTETLILIIEMRPDLWLHDICTSTFMQYRTFSTFPLNCTQHV